MDKYIVTNFAYGTGPYLRTTELALAFNNELKKAGIKRMKIIVPLVYGEKQKNIMKEQFNDLSEIVFDEKLGAILKSVFYENNSYGDSLKNWVENFQTASLRAQKHLKEKYKDLIALELARSPRLDFGVSPAYFSSFAYLHEILESAQKLFAVDIAREFEKKYRIHAIAYPATFSFLEERGATFNSEILVPPIIRPPQENLDLIEQGIFATVTGIGGLERLYEDAKKLGIKVYSNDPKAVPGSIKAAPHVISNKNILLHFARSGWSSVWISMIAGTPLIVPEFDSDDDPEIYFNNKSVEKLGLGIVYKGQSLKEILEASETIKNNYSRIKKDILKRWGTLDGNAYCAKLFAEDFLKNKSNSSKV